MKKITLNYKEFYLFKQLADFWYSFSVSSGMIYIEADSKLLENLGY